MNRDFLHAYLRLQEAHKELHKLLKAFETDASNEELRRLLGETYRLLNMVETVVLGDRDNVQL
ncbi:hypothetical protein H6G89_14680 [Oscillatoria sp. FACHB-1407]|uniref:hypothetical protein n=1 Tax=Oscillatoria sp. FACHB-1407 TaxID=2692847 RepID=UPI00168992C7|nr:hypothetical protein [Oscillatoria sp. FACHB-1407]MBD2462291.1 hypothetical protein [Oscillatoria sp. FACHB-1407]